MSAVYSIEPPPTAKVILRTSSGDIELELFAKQTPLASRNFLQHCLDGYYDNTLFHRLIPGFIIQGGDPTGTGSGGSSAFEDGRPFADEFHSRLKFNRPGLLGMANDGTKDDNGSQFFLTLDKAEHLTGHNTMFGRVVGDTRYNLVRMGEAALTEEEDSERPLYPTVLTGADIIINPFTDMVKKIKEAPKPATAQSQEKKKPKKRLGKQVLSFADDGEDEVVASTTMKPMSKPKRSKSEKTKQDDEPKPKQEAAKPKLEAAKPKPATEPVRTEKPRNEAPREPSEDRDSLESWPDPEEVREKKQLAEAEAEIARLRKSLKRSAPAPVEPEPEAKRTAVDALVPEGARRGRRKGDAKAERRGIDYFNKFQAKLDAAVRSEPAKSASNGATASATTTGETAPPHDERDEEPCELHFVPNCESCKKWDATDPNAVDEKQHEGLLSHRLTFARDRLGKDLEWKRQNEKDLVVLDPREHERQNHQGKDRRKR